MNERPFMRAEEIHARIGNAWPQILSSLGVAEQYLAFKTIGGRNRGKPGPCPVCGGTDRYTFDNRHGHGDYICRGCGAGDGFRLLERVHGWSFSQARRQVMNAIGLSDGVATAPTTNTRGARKAISRAEMAQPTQRVRAVLRGSCAVSDCPDAIAYLESRNLWPLPEGCSLRAHPALEYWNGAERIGRYPALIAEVRDLTGELVTIHATYLEAGRKLSAHEPRKILSPLNGRDGCAVRLMVPSAALGIGEGVETALSAGALERISVWAALNTSLLARFEPPPGLERLVIYADRDIPGLLAAGRLMERLQGRLRIELRVPPEPRKDFNDVLKHQGAAHG